MNDSNSSQSHPGRPRRFETSPQRAPKAPIGIALALTLGAWLTLDLPSGQAAQGDDTPRPWSVQLHVHGPFSEGLGSIDSQSHEASSVGLDVLWWSEHDWRLSSYHTLSRFDFEPGPVEQVVEQDRLGAWTLTDSRYDPRYAPELRVVPRRSAAEGSVGFSDERARSGSQSLRISAVEDGPEFRNYVALLRAPIPGYQRPLAAGLRLNFALWIDRADGDGKVWLEARLSEHPLSEELLAERPGSDGYATHAIRYVLGGDTAAPHRDGNVYWVPLEHRAGEWNDFRVELTRDAERGFPELAGADNSLTQIHLGLSARRGREIVTYLDEVAIEAERRGEVMYSVQRALIERVSKNYPGLRQLQGLEISYLTPHFNEFSVGTELLDYDAVAAASGLLDEEARVSEAALRDHLALRAVEQAHGRGGLISYNHSFGTNPDGSEAKWTRDEVLEQLLASELYGTDLLEVGYRDRGGHSLGDHLWIWDQLALRGGLRPVGIGVSDHHGGPDRWRTMPNNFVTWIVAPSPTKPDLIEGLRAGRAYFGDLTEFRGALELVTDAGHRMGQLVLTDRARVAVAISATGLPRKARVDVIESGQRTAQLEGTPKAFEARRELTLPEGGGFVRVETYGRGERALAFSNPIHFLREVPAGGLDPARGALDLGGVRSVKLGGFRIAAARAPEGNRVELEGTASGGTLVLDCSSFGTARAGARGKPQVELEGLAGEVDVRRERVVLRRLSGTGRIVLTR